VEVAVQKVWFRKSKNCWYATIRENGGQKQIRLLEAPDTAEGKKLAEKELIRELADRDISEDGIKAPGWMTISHILQGFFKHSRQEHTPETAAWYKTVLTPFETMWGELPYRRLRRKHVKTWLGKTGYNPTSQNKALGGLKRAFNWAVEEELIPKNPIAHVRKPKALTRDRTLEPAERELILASIKDAAFRDFVAAMTLTGCRPGEVMRVCPEHVNLTAGIWELPKHKTAKKTGKPRRIYLCPEAVELTKRLMENSPESSPLFLNSRKKPWTRNAVRIRFRRLRKKFPQLKGVVAYTYRASFATDALEQGVPDATVSALLGHTNTDTLHRFYARLGSRVEHLKDAAGKAAKGAGDAPREVKQ
jgi:integrase